jgi:hypothetical protein
VIADRPASILLNFVCEHRGSCPAFGLSMSAATADPTPQVPCEIWQFGARVRVGSATIGRAAP